MTNDDLSMTQTRRPAEARERLLIYAPVPLHVKDGQLYMDDQACNGVRLWAENFETVSVMMPLDPGTLPQNWVPVARLGPVLERVEIVPLPMAYRPDRFFRHLPQTRRKIRTLIDRSSHLSFAIGGLFGDWGAVGCYEAHTKGRAFGVWTDRVESEVVRRGMTEGHWRARLRSRLYHRPMAMLEKSVIRRATLGLFHGRETFETYAPYCKNPQIVHDIHLNKSDHISPAALQNKIAQAAAGPLQIVYLGRADPMKGPQDWLSVLEKLDAEGIDFQACWLGDGSELAAMRARVQAAGLASKIELPGFTTDRSLVLDRLRKADVFLFCHKTPESPRCLIEALVSGTPIVGYEGAFASDLIANHQGGNIVPLNDVAALTKAVAGLAQDRDALADLFSRAAEDGKPYDDESVFHHRSALLKRYL